MQVQLPLFILCLLIHAGIYQTSVRSDRRMRFVSGLLLLTSTWLVWLAGKYIAGIESSSENLAIIYPMLGLVMLNAPYYLPVFSFLVYLKR